MSSGTQEIGGALDFEECSPDVAPVGRARFCRRNGVLQVSIDGGPFAPLPTGGGNALASLIAQLTSTTPGNESSRILATTLMNGVPTPALDIRGGQILFPFGTFAAPGISFQGWPNYGILFDALNAAVGIVLAGTYQASFQFNFLTHPIDSYLIKIGTLSQLLYGADGLNAEVASTLGHSQLGVGGATAIGATTGMVDLPGMAGVPTAAQVPKTGHAIEIVDTTNHKRWQFEGPSTRWVCLNRRGKGADIASASVLTTTPSDRAAFDYFHTTGAVNIDFIRFDVSGGDIYSPILDGEEVTLYFGAGLTLNHNTGAPPAGTYPLQLVGAANAAVAANSKMKLRRDVAQTRWVEMWRSGA